MGTIHNKIKSNSGVTILMALMLLLIAIFISSIVLSVSLTGIMARKTDMINKQEYLTVKSAMNLFKDEILDTSCSIDEDGDYKIDECNFFPIIDRLMETREAIDPIQAFTIKESTQHNFEPVNVACMINPDSLNIEAKFYTDSCVMFLTIEANHIFRTSIITEGEGENERSREVEYDDVSWVAYEIQKDTDNSELKYYDGKNIY